MKLDSADHFQRSETNGKRVLVVSRGRGEKSISRPRETPNRPLWVRAEIHDPNSANNSRAIFVLKVRLAHLALRVTLVNN